MTFRTYTTSGGTTGLMILPLRYSAFGASDEAQAVLPAKLPSPLGGTATPVALKQSRYTIRFLRQGKLYLFAVKAGVTFCKAFHVTCDAFFYEFESTSPPAATPEFSCYRSA
jgi:hypothetical protein